MRIIRTQRADTRSMAPPYPNLGLLERVRPSINPIQARSLPALGHAAGSSEQLIESLVCEKVGRASCPPFERSSMDLSHDGVVTAGGKPAPPKILLTHVLTCPRAGQQTGPTASGTGHQRSGESRAIAARRSARRAGPCGRARASWARRSPAPRRADARTHPTI